MRRIDPSNRLLISALLFLLISLGPVSWTMGAEKVVSPPPGGSAPESLVGGTKDGNLTREGDEIPAWRARWELARLLSYTKRYVESLQQYRKLLAEKPDLSEARAEMAKVLYWSGHKAEALKALEALSNGQITSEAKLLKADLLAGDKKYKEAIKLYREYLKVKPGDLEARFRLAQVLSWDKQYPPALKEFEAILSQKPEDMQVRRHYAFVLSWDGQFEKAAEELKRTLKD